MNDSRAICKNFAGNPQVSLLELEITMLLLFILRPDSSLLLNGGAVDVPTHLKLLLT